MSKLNQLGIVQTLPLLLVVAAVGIISYLLISSTLPLGGILGNLNPKPASQAARPGNPTPTPSTTYTPMTVTSEIYSQWTPSLGCLGTDSQFNWSAAGSL